MGMNFTSLSENTYVHTKGFRILKQSGKVVKILICVFSVCIPLLHQSIKVVQPFGFPCLDVFVT